MSSGELEVKSGRIDVPGGNVGYKIVGADSPGIPLLTLHGGPGYPSTDLMPLEALGRERPVVFYDQLGCGKSMLPDKDSRDYSHLWNVDRFVDELVRIREGVGLDDMHLLGFSWGGSLAVEYMLQEERDGISSLTLASPFLSASRFQTEIHEVAQRLGQVEAAALKELASNGNTEDSEYQRLFNQFIDRFIIGRELDTFTKDQRAALNASEKKKGNQVEAVMMGKSEFHITGPLKDFERVDDLWRLGSIPVLYTCGRADYITPESVEICHGATPGSELVVFENSAHFAHFTETDEYLQKLSSFLHNAEAKSA